MMNQTTVTHPVKIPHFPAKWKTSISEKWKGTNAEKMLLKPKDQVLIVIDSEF